MHEKPEEISNSPSFNVLWVGLRSGGSVAVNSELVGDKAFRISQMMQLELPTPGGWVLCRDALEMFLRFNQLETPIGTIVDALVGNELEQLNTASERIANLIRSGQFPHELKAAVETILSELPKNELIVVRSSAIGEDSTTAAFAGQLDSLLSIEPTVPALLDAIRTCWASYWSSRVLFYQRTRGVCLQGMAVLIQPQVKATVSGILFTVSPTDDGDHHEMMIEYCTGLGDGLAGGSVTPDRVSVDRRTLKVQHVSCDSGKDDSAKKVLVNTDAWFDLAEIGLKLEKHFKAPQDIEWSLDQAGRLVLLQSRPITTLKTFPRTSTKKLVVWSNVNVNENYPDPVCPLLFSIAQRAYYHYFRNLGIAFGIAGWRIAKMEKALKQIVGAQGGRLYYNLSNIHDVLRSAPFGNSLVASFNLFVGAELDASTHDDDRSWVGNQRGPLRQACEVVWIAIRASWSFLRMASRVKRFEKRADQFALACQAVVENRVDAQARRESLLDQFRKFLEIRFHGWLEASMADAAAMISYSAWQRFVRANFPADQDSSLHNSLLKGLRDVVSGKPALQLWDISRSIRADKRLSELFATRSDGEVFAAVQNEPCFDGFRSDIGNYLATWGFRCSGELMLTVPSLREQPELLISMLRTYAEQTGAEQTGAEQTGAPPHLQLEQQQELRQAATCKLVDQLRKQRMLHWLPWFTKAPMGLFLLRWTQQAIGCRERARLKQAMLYQCLRSVCLALGEVELHSGRLEVRDDLLYLNCEEIETYFSGGALLPQEIRDTIRRRRELLEQLSKVQPPDTFALEVGESWTTESRNQREAKRSNEAEEETNAWQGQGVCGGSVTGTANVLRDVSEAAKLKSGDILVTRQTDPGWGPVFLLIRGLVMERGGMLSHGAIMAREYGLPTVVGIPHATSTISSGQSVLVDGDRGIVQRM